MIGQAVLNGAVAQDDRTEPTADTGNLRHSLWACHIGLSASAAAFGAVAATSGDPLSHAVLVGVAVVGTVSGFRLLRHIERPIEDLAGIAEAAARHPGAVAPIASDLALRPDAIGRLARALDDLQGSSCRRLQANADFAHEIRNPLASLRSAAEGLRHAQGERQDRLLFIVENDVQRLDHLIGELSRASRLQADMVGEVARPFDFIAMVRRLMGGIERATEAKNIDLICDLPAGPFLIPGIEARLTQVVANVVENAISLCEEGDAIRIGTRLREDRLLFVVEDTGPGIPDGGGEAIFRRFYSRREPGRCGRNSGLGLAIARQIVEAHGGLIWAEDIRPTARDLLSQPLGARFVVALPL